MFSETGWYEARWRVTLLRVLDSVWRLSAEKGVG